MVFACLVAFVAAKPGGLYTAPAIAPAVVSAYSSPLAYSGYSSPLAYSGVSPLAYSAYSGAAPLAYTGYTGYNGIAPVAYTSTYNGGYVKSLPYSSYVV